MDRDRLKIFTGNANPSLAREICEELDVPEGQSKVGRFSDGEVRVQILENVRGADVFVVQPTCHPVNTNLMELMLMIDALKRASARRITAVIPYYGYSRQDRKDRPRVPVSARVVADMVTVVGADRVLTMDLHAPQIQGFFQTPVDNLLAAPVLVDYFRQLALPDLTIVAPDAGGVERARYFAKNMHSALAIVDKRRTDANISEVMHVIGDVEGRTALVVDDIIDTAGTLVKTSDALIAHGAKAVYACCTHPVLSGEAIDRICGSQITQVVVTNSIPLTERAAGCGRMKTLSVGPLLAHAIQSIHEETSVSVLFLQPNSDS